MTTIAPKSEKKEFELVPQGAHIARCISFIHIGTNPEQFPDGQKDMNKIRLTFEIPGEMRKFGDTEKPMVISQEYTLSMFSKAGLRKLVEGILGVALLDQEADSFDVESIVGKACIIQVVHKTAKSGSKYTIISGAMSLMKGQEAPRQFNPSKILSYSNWDKELFEVQPKFIKEKIMSSKEYKAMTGGHKSSNDIEFPVENIDPNDIPF